PVTLKPNTVTSYNGTFSPSAQYYDDYRYRRHPAETFSFGRIFRIRESVTFSARIEFTNAFNRTNILNAQYIVAGYSTPISTTTAPNGLKVNNGGFGAVQTLPTNAVIGERSGLLV